MIRKVQRRRLDEGDPLPTAVPERETGWLELRVPHTPAPQGSKIGFVRKGGKGAGVREANKNVEPYRQAVRVVVDDYIDAFSDTGVWEPLDGPMEAHCVFTLPKPQSAPKTRVTYPDKKPDIDKLIRATFDALSQAGFWRDDARVVWELGEKCFPGEHPLAFSATGTGAVIRVRKR